jgi:Protein of unknown function (DUF2846)
MKTSSCFLVAAIFVASAPPIAVGAQDKQKGDSSELTVKEMEQKACGPRDKEVRFSVGADKSKHPTPAPSADKAMIYVIRPAWVGMLMQTKLAVDGDWKGANRANNYFFFTLDPGEHYFCSEAYGSSVLKLKVEASKTYYVQQHVEIHPIYASHGYNHITVMTEDEGKAKLAAANLSTSRIK